VPRRHPARFRCWIWSKLSNRSLRPLHRWVCRLRLCTTGEPEPHRSRPSPGCHDCRVGRTGEGSADPRARDRARGRAPSKRPVEGARRPTGRWEVVATLVSEGFPSRSCDGSSGRPCRGSTRAATGADRRGRCGHAMVAEVIREVHDTSSQTYGTRRVHARDGPWSQHDRRPVHDRAGDAPPRHRRPGRTADAVDGQYR